MVNFYRVLKRSETFEQLCDEIDLSLFSEWQYNEAKSIWKAGKGDSKIMRAWAVFILSHQSFSASMGNSWGFNRHKNRARQFGRVKKQFDERYLRRMEGVQIFCRDALNVIANMDMRDTFHFIDPPYFNSDMGHYDGYTANDFEDLLKLLEGIKGKFLLSSYPSKLLEKYTELNNWHTINNKMHLSASNSIGKTKTEVFTMNYHNEDLGQLSLF